MTKKKTTKIKKQDKYQKPLTLHGFPEKEVVRTLLKSPPMPKPKKNK